MDAAYRIRPGTAADLPAVARIERAVFSDPWWDRTLLEGIQGWSLVVQAGRTVVGYIFLRALAGEAEILNIAVAPAHQGRGVGRRLLAAALEQLRHAGIRRVYLEVRESNAQARGFYQRQGFRQIGRRSAYYRNPPEAALVFARDLTPSERPA